MASTSSSSSSRYNHAFTHLRSIFPNVDPTYLDNCIQSYPSTHSFTADKIIARVITKMLDLNHGNWPTVLLKDMSRLTNPNAAANTAAYRKGKGRASTTSTYPLGQGTLIQVDEVATRNAALILLNDMFPEVDLGYLRQALLESSHSYLYSSLASLLSDATLSPDAISQWHAMDSSNSLHSNDTQQRKKNKHEPLPKRSNPGEISYSDLIKDEKYAEHTLQLLCAQFPNVWKSSIKAIMAEHNNDYFTSVEAVKRVQEERSINFFARTWAVLTQALSSSKSNSSNTPSLNTKEGFSIANYLSNHPNPASLSPMLLYELQLHLSLTKPPPAPSSITASSSSLSSSSSRKKEQQMEQQHFECGCCFSDISFIEITTCTNGCIFCKECLSRTVQESVYGQAPLHLHRPVIPNKVNVNDDKDNLSSSRSDDYGGEGTGIRCLSIEGCQAPFSDKELRRCLPKELYNALEERLAQQNLQLLQLAEKKKKKSKKERGNSKQVRLVQCPFCTYVEVEDIPTINDLWTGTSSILELSQSVASIIVVGCIYFCWILSAIFIPDLLNITSSNMKRTRLSNIAPLSNKEEKQDPIYLAVQPIEGFRCIQDRIPQILDTCLTKRNGTVFRCRNVQPNNQKVVSTTFGTPALIYSMLPPPPPSTLTVKGSVGSLTSSTSASSCGRLSCRLCMKLHYAGHECLDSKAGLRILKEQAASNAIKRQCPECELSFVKDNGCNKIVCRCGYVMCFVCRKGIAEERYAHFCQHVRDPPGSPCTVCTKCDLFKEEDERLAVKKAVKRAEEDWLREHPDSDSDTIRTMNDNSFDFAPQFLETLEQYTHRALEGLCFLQTRKPKC